MNKAKRIIDNMDKQDALKICKQIGTVDEKATPLRQARYINDILNTAEKMNICMTQKGRISNTMVGLYNYSNSQPE